MKKLLLTLLTLGAVLSLFACAKNEPESDPLPLAIEFYRDGAARFEVIAAGDSPEAVEAAKAFCEQFEAQTGIKLPLSYNKPNKKESIAGKTEKIIFGKTDHASSISAYDCLRYQNFKIEITHSVIAVAAHTTECFAGAVEHLSANLIPAVVKGNGSYVPESDPLLVDVRVGDGTYAVEEATVLGVPLGKYRIVYSGVSHEATAITLRDSIIAQTGYVLDCVRDGFSDPTPYEILLGDTSRKESGEVDTPAPLHYVLRPVGTKLVLKAGGNHSLVLASEQMIADITQNITSLKIDETFSFSNHYINDPHDYSFAQGADIRIMSANVQASLYGYNTAMVNAGFNFNRCPEIFFSALEVYEPTVIGLQECCSNWSREIQRYDGYDKWSLLAFDNPNVANESVFSTIMYRKDLLTLVDSGSQYFSAYDNKQCRCMTWAIFKLNSNGKEFAFISTHWDISRADSSNEHASNSATQCAEMTELINKLSERYPVFSTGDFNNSEISTVFKKLLADTNSEDCMHVAINRVNQESSHHGWGKPTTSQYSVDHILAPRNARVLKFESLIYSEQIYASDHSWLIADVEIP